MNENNEKNMMPEASDKETSSEAFKVEFNDKMVESDAENEKNSDTVAETSVECEENAEKVENCVTEHPTNADDMTYGDDTEQLANADEMAELAKIFEDPSTPNDNCRRHHRKKRRISTKALIRESNLAICLSAISIILLVAIAALLSVGILPAGNRMVYVSVSPLGPVETQSGAASAELLENFKNSVVIIDVTRAQSGGTGSGIILSSDGFIVTNYHVIEDAQNITVTFYGKEKKLPATVVGYSERDDIAVIKVEAEGLAPAVFANSADCRVGDRVYAIGAPEGSAFGWSVTSGIISEPLRELKIYASDYVLEKKMYVLQTDAPVNPGNSGGPLINARGEVVGIVTMKRSDAAGMGFALPSSASLELIEAIIEHGNADSVVSGISKGRPLIGITGAGLEAGVWYELTPNEVRKVTDSYAATHPKRCIKLSVSGIYVTSLTPDLDASNHLLTGDVITHINNIEVFTIYDVMDVINEYNGGDTIKITFVRDGETLTANVTLGIEE